MIIKITTKNKLSNDETNLLQYMFGKFSNILNSYNTKSNSSYVYSIVLENKIQEEEIDKIVEFWYNNVDEDTFFEAPDMNFSEEDIDIKLDSLAKFMHNTMIKEKMDNGWRYGEKFSLENKTSPLLISWDQLPEEHKIRRPDIFQKVIQLIS